MWHVFWCEGLCEANLNPLQLHIREQHRCQFPSWIVSESPSWRERPHGRSWQKPGNAFHAVSSYNTKVTTLNWGLSLYLVVHIRGDKENQYNRRKRRIIVILEFRFYEDWYQVCNSRIVPATLRTAPKQWTWICDPLSVHWNPRQLFDQRSEDLRLPPPSPRTELYKAQIFRECPDRPWGRPSHLYDGYRVSSPGVKRRGRGIDH